MGLTAHNKKRREMDAVGNTNQVRAATAHLDTAIRKVEAMEVALAEAEDHLEAMEVAHKAAVAWAKPKAPKAKKPAPKAKKPAPKKGK